MNTILLLFLLFTFPKHKSKVVKIKKQLAEEYGVCLGTFKKWIKPIEKQLKLTRRPLLEWQINMIYDFLDKP